MKIVDYCDSNKQEGRTYVSNISMKPCKLQGGTAGSQGEALINAGWVKNGRVKERNVKMPVGKTRPLKTVALAVRRSRESWEWKCRESVCDELGWKYKMGVKTRR